MIIHQLAALEDNFIYILQEAQEAWVIDPGSAEPVGDFLEKQALDLTKILITHRHPDHVGGILALKEKYACEVWGPLKEKDLIPGIDRTLQEGDTFSFAQLQCQVLDMPGHTKGHINYWWPEIATLFCGDVIFALGCGKIFDGSFAGQAKALQRISSLPPTTKLYCSHEYTLENSQFALLVEPENSKLQERVRKEKEMRAKGLFTVPSLLAEELETNPFLRLHSKEILARAKISSSQSAEEKFRVLRQAKDYFDKNGQLP